MCSIICAYDAAQRLPGIEETCLPLSEVFVYFGISLTASYRTCCVSTVNTSGGVGAGIEVQMAL